MTDRLKARRVLRVTTGVLLAAAAAAITPALANRAPVHFHEDDRIDARLDPRRIAVQFSGGSTEPQRSAELRSMGIAMAASDGAVRWRVLRLPDALSGKDEVDRRIEQLLELPSVEFASPVFEDNDGWKTITRQIIVRFELAADEDAERLLETSAPEPFIVKRTFGGMSGCYLLDSYLSNGFDVLSLSDVLARIDGVRWAEPDFRFSAVAHSNDPFFDELWGIRNTGQFDGTPNVDTDADEAWAQTTGSPAVPILILGDGVQQDHPDINQLPGRDLTTDGGDGGPVNACDTHETKVAGCASAIIDNALGVVGVAPGSPVISARVCISEIASPCTRSGQCQSSWIVEALDWGRAQGARVSNFSWSLGMSQSIADAYAHTRDAGMVHFASAGNDALPEVSSPARLPTVNAIGAITSLGVLAEFSNYGADLSLVAPGADIWTTDGTTGFARVGGTSFAAPYAAAVAALLIAYDPTLSIPQVETRLRCSARDLGDVGFDTRFGFGLVNAVRALRSDDDDGDGIVQTCDNCLQDANPDQANADGDTWGDACDPCTDGDGDQFGDPGFSNTCETDNCPLEFNFDQADFDGDGNGDVCDNCWLEANPGQVDTDRDGDGDVCDRCPSDPEDDGDGDGICGDLDNCRNVMNARQFDRDGDGLGDACDDDGDNDGVVDDVDCAPSAPGVYSAPRPVLATLRLDGHGDTRLTWRSAPYATVYNVYSGTLAPGAPWHYDETCLDGWTPLQESSDPTIPPSGAARYYLIGAANVCGESGLGQDGQGNDRSGPGDCESIDRDADADGLSDAEDNCSALGNVDQQDIDGDGVGDVCDNCVVDWNPDQADVDDDGIGDRCDLCAESGTIGEPRARPLTAQTALDSGGDYRPDLVLDEDGNGIATWRSDDSLGGTVGTDADVLFSRTIDGGLSWSTPRAIRPDAATDGEGEAVATPRVATDGNGIWLVGWSTLEIPALTGDLLVSRSDDDGAQWSSPRRLNDPGFTRDNFLDDLVTDGAGTWIAVWSSSDPSTGLGEDFDLMISVSHDAGLTWNDQRPLLGDAASDTRSDYACRLATDGAGNWVAAWIGRVADLDILYSVSSDNGSSWSTPRAVATWMSADDSVDQAPRIATDGEGFWMLAWDSDNSLRNTLGDDNDVLYVTSRDDGSNWTDASPLNTDAATDDRIDFLRDLAVDADGRGVAVWRTDIETARVMYALTDDQAGSWSASRVVPEVNCLACSTTVGATPGNGSWLMLTESVASLDQTIGDDPDIVLSVIAPECRDCDGDGFGAPGHPSCRRGAQTDCDDRDGGIGPCASQTRPL